MRLGILIILAVLLAPIAVADVPMTFTYQGVLMDDRGDPLPDGEYLVQFRLFDRDEGGTALWHEDHALFTYEGLFSATLGEDQAFHLTFDRTYWLEMELHGEHPMAPRVQLTAVPYAMYAMNGGGGGGDDDWVIDGSDIYRETGQVAIGTTPSTTGARVHVEDSTIGLYAEVTEPDAAADNRSAIYAIRFRAVPNPGIGFGVSQTNNAITAVNNDGDSYTFGLAGYTQHQNPHTAGVLGSSHFPFDDEWGRSELHGFRFAGVGTLYPRCSPGRRNIVHGRISHGSWSGGRPHPDDQLHRHWNVASAPGRVLPALLAVTQL